MHKDALGEPSMATNSEHRAWPASSLTTRLASGCRPRLSGWCSGVDEGLPRQAPRLSNQATNSSRYPTKERRWCARRHKLTAGVAPCAEWAARRAIVLSPVAISGSFLIELGHAAPYHRNSYRSADTVQKFRRMKRPLYGDDRVRRQFVPFRGILLTPQRNC
jgi:hypothetical protein